MLLSKERKIFKNIYNKRLDKRDKLSKKIIYSDLQFIANSIGQEINFSELKNPVAFLDSIKNREILIEEAQHRQEEFNSYLKK